MDKYSDLQSQVFQYHMEKDEMEDAYKQQLVALQERLNTQNAESSNEMILQQQRLSELEAECDALRRTSVDKDAAVLRSDELEAECAALIRKNADKEQRLGELEAECETLKLAISDG